MAEEVLGEISADIGLNLKGLIAGAAKAKSELLGVESTMGKVGVATVALAGGALMYAAHATEAYESLGKEVFKFKEITGASAEDASKMIYIGKQWGVNSQALSLSLQRLGSHIGQNDAAYKSLGVSLTDAHGKALPLMQIMEKLSGVFSKKTPGLDRAGVAKDLFGRASRSILPMLDAGPDAMKDMANQAVKDGDVMTDKDAEAAMESSMAHKQLEASMEGVSVQVGREFLPMIDAAVTATHSFFQEITGHPEIAHVIADFAKMGMAFGAMKLAMSMGGKLGIGALLKSSGTAEAAAATKAETTALAQNAAASDRAAVAANRLAASKRRVAGANRVAATSAKAEAGAEEESAVASKGAGERNSKLTSGLVPMMVGYTALSMAAGAFIGKEHQVLDNQLKAQGMGSGEASFVSRLQAADSKVPIIGGYIDEWDGAATEKRNAEIDETAGNRMKLVNDVRAGMTGAKDALHDYNKAIDEGSTASTAYGLAQETLKEKLDEHTQAAEDAANAEAELRKQVVQTGMQAAAGIDFLGSAPQLTKSVHHDAVTKDESYQVPVYDEAGVQTGTETKKKKVTVSKAHDSQVSTTMSPQKALANATANMNYEEGNLNALGTLRKDLHGKMTQSFAQQLLNWDKADPGSLQALAHTHSMGVLNALQREYTNTEKIMVRAATDQQSMVDSATGLLKVENARKSQLAADNAIIAQAKKDAPRVAAALSSAMPLLTGPLLNRGTGVATKPGSTPTMASLYGIPTTGGSASSGGNTASGSGDPITIINHNHGAAPSVADQAVHNAAQIRAAKRGN